MQRSPAAFAIVCALLACTDPAPAPLPPPLPRTEPASAPVAPPVELTNATVEEAALVLARASSRPVIVDPGAQRFARCAHVTIGGAGARPEQLLTLFRGAIAPSGFSLDEGASGIVVRHQGSAPPGCAGAAIAETLEARPTAPVDTSGFAAEVREVGPGEIVITEAGTAMLRDDVGALERSARIIPHEENGRVVGLKLYGIRRASMAGILGLQNGDTVISVNGSPITAPDSALEAYASLRGATDVTVRIERRGVEQTLHYRVVERLPPAR